jgi:GNAT superfamily N-acetyltransferase
MVRIRGYEERDAAGIARLFHETVHAVNRADYTPEQLRAWAPDVPDPEIWHARMSTRCTLVAEEADEVIAFAELEGDGHLDMLYCRWDVVGRSIGSSLYRVIEREALGRGLARITTEASITARPFFERHGFVVVREQLVALDGVELTNFAMEKHL